jgi:hypothetical protein
MAPDQELMVEVEKERGFHRIHVALRRRGPREEIFHLALAAGIRAYEYDSPGALDRALLQAREHFDQWGAAWLNGNNIETPALLAVAMELRRLARDRLISEGRAAFKRKELDEAVAQLSEAEAVAPLDEVSRKMLELARRSRQA